jgi:hypothetical protein
MNRIFPTILFLLLSWLPLHANPKVISEYGPRPENGIYDPENSLSPELVDRLAADLKVLHSRDGADVIVVILPTMGELPAEHVAKRFSDAWAGEDLLCAVVLDVTGRNDGPWIHIGGSVTNSDRRDVIPSLVQQGLRRARQEPDRESALRSAAEESSNIIRFLLGRVKKQSDDYLARLTKLRLEEEMRQERKRKILIASGVGVVGGSGLLCLIVIAVLRWRPRHFPLIVPARRLGAPYAGGNNAIFNLGPPPQSR